MIGDANGREAPFAHQALRRGDEVAVDVPVEHGGRVAPLERPRQAHHSERKARAAPRRDRGIDQQDLRQLAHESRSRGCSHCSTTISMRPPIVIAAAAVTGHPLQRAATRRGALPGELLEELEALDQLELRAR